MSTNGFRLVHLRFHASHYVMTGTVLVILFVSSFSTINNSILPIRAVAAEVENYIFYIIEVGQTTGGLKDIKTG